MRRFYLGEAWRPVRQIVTAVTASVRGISRSCAYTKPDSDTSETSTGYGGIGVLVDGFSHAQARPASSSQVVDLFAGGADARERTFPFTFGADCKMSNYRSTQTNIGTGLASGTRQKPGYNQP